MSIVACRSPCYLFLNTCREASTHRGQVGTVELSPTAHTGVLHGGLGILQFLASAVEIPQAPQSGVGLYRLESRGDSSIASDEARCPRR